MKPAWTATLLLTLVSISGVWSFAQARDRDPGFPTTLNDSRTPFLRLVVPADPSTPAFPVSVVTADPSGIASVSISVEGVVVATRLRPPFDFSVEAPALPVEVCALAVDRAGNSTTECKLAGVQGTCLSSDECQGLPDPQSYCRYPYGVCGGRGRCVVRPSPCALEPMGPVCGCDGKTYETECHAELARVSVQRDGVCPGDRCEGNEDCSRGRQCQKLPGNCASRGFCAPIPGGPCNCPIPRPPFPSQDLVCGCDGKTYETCLAGCRKVSIAHRGPCRQNE